MGVDSNVADDGGDEWGDIFGVFELLLDKFELELEERSLTQINKTCPHLRSPIKREWMDYSTHSRLGIIATPQDSLPAASLWF